MSRREVSVVMVGRDDELGRLHAALDAGGSGPTAVVVVGEVGVGKTRLVTKFQAAARGSARWCCAARA